MNCSICRGILTKGIVNHSISIEESVIIIKKVPANICIQCGEYYVDTNTAIRLGDIIQELRQTKSQVSIINYMKKE